MRKGTKLIVSVTAMVMSASVLTACGGGIGGLFPDNNGPSISSDKVQIYVGSFDGGYGQEFIRAWGAEFEKLNADREFTLPNGEKKVGVEVIPNVSSDYGAQVTSTIASSNDEIIFAEAFDYNAMRNSGLAVDITDIMKAVSPYDGKTIASKMTADQIKFYAEDGKFYGLPQYESHYNLYYDVDLFEQNGYFFAKDGNLIKTNYKLAEEQKNLSDGPDGLSDTYDDGLPATMDQFFVLCDKMVTDNVIPVTYAGSLQFYYNQFLMSVWANCSGYNNMYLNYTYDGMATDIVTSISADGSVNTTSLKITPENGYMLQKQAGKYYALKFTERLFDGTKNYLSDKCNDNAVTHIDNQDAFLKSRFSSGGGTTKPIAMTIDGAWWYNEAAETMKLMAQTVSPDCAANVRRIGVMPLFNAAPNGQRNVLFACNYPTTIVNAKTESWKLPLVKEFLQFAMSDWGLSKFTVTVNCPFALKYSLTEEDEKNASYLVKAAMQYHNSSEVIYPQATSKLYKYSAVPLAGSSNLSFYSLVDQVVSTSPSISIGQKGKSALQYFNGLADYWTKEYWGTKYGNILN